jgi:hypothetical protein
VGSFWGRCGARPKGQGQDFFHVFFLVVFFPCAQASLTLTLAPLSDWKRHLYCLSQLCCGWLRGRGKGQGAGHCGACVVLFLGGLGASCFCCPFSHAPPCCRNPIHVNQPCLALFVSRRLHFAASSQRVCAAPLGCCRESGVGFWACLAHALRCPPPLFCERLFALVFVRPDPRPVPFPNPYRISPDPSDWLTWMHSAWCGLLQGRAWAWALVRWVVGLFFCHWQCRNGAGGLMVLLARVSSNPPSPVRLLQTSQVCVPVCFRMDNGVGALGLGVGWGLGLRIWCLPRPGLGRSFL